MTVKEASKVLGCDVLTVRLLLQKGVPWGSAYKLNDSAKHFYYVVYDKEFERLFGGVDDGKQ